MEVTGRVSRLIQVNGTDQSEVGNARRQALQIGTTLDFSELRCGQLGIVVTEAARNLSVHGGGGEIVLTPWQFGKSSGVDVLALDRGMGIADIAVALQDGYSTGSTPGTGLGAIRRLAHTFEVYSQERKGTAVFARVLHREGKAGEPAVARLGTLNVPFSGETLSGDGWSAVLTPERSVYVMADGLGHGPVASEAAQEAVSAFQQHAGGSPKQILQAVHEALGKTRGAAVAVAEILPAQKVLHYTGAGNIAASIHGQARTKSLVSMNGTPGHNMSTVQQFTYDWSDRSTLLMHSDGLGTRWNLDSYPGLAQRHPALIAGILYRDFSRRRDDATILVARV